MSQSHQANHSKSSASSLSRSLLVARLSKDFLKGQIIVHLLFKVKAVVMEIATFATVTAFLFLINIEGISSFSLRTNFFKVPRITVLKDNANNNNLPNKAAILAPKAADAVEKWLLNEPFDQILPRENLSAAVREFQSNSASLESNKALFEKWWLQFEATVREEVRPLKVILGSQVTLELLEDVEKADVYDPTTVRAFLQNPAFETMIGGILYEGIFEFIQRVDIIGNVVNKLPIIGPIRQTIMSEFKKSLDKSLGGQVKVFLSSFNRVAVQRMIDFILSPSNRISLQKANRNVVQSFLERPLSNVIPDAKFSLMVRDQIWKALTEVPTAEAISIGRYFNFIFYTLSTLM